METATRNATLSDLAELLKEQHARKLDVVAPATSIRAQGGVLSIADTDVIPDADGGFRQVPGVFAPTAVCDEGLAEKLGIPGPYLRKLHSERLDLFDGNINGWLHGRQRKNAAGETTNIYKPDNRKFLVRCFQGQDGNGIARAFLSDGYKIIDNLDVLTAALEGVKKAGVEINIDGCDLTERRMYVRITAPEVQALAPTLLKGYRSPFDQGVARAGGREGVTVPPFEAPDRPIVFAGFVLSNSETGNGAFTIVPRLVFQICTNGLTITKDAMRSVHLGAKLNEGIVKWSDETQEKNLELVTSMTADAVGTFLDTKYVEAKIAELEEKAATSVTDAAKTVELVSKSLRFSEERQAGVLDHFIRGGQMTAGGVLNAVTSYAQTIHDADTAMDIENVALRAMELAAR